ncbi:hypothetical protein FKM82_009656 [Ascaphus truei]
MLYAWKPSLVKVLFILTLLVCLFVLPFSPMHVCGRLRSPSYELSLPGVITVHFGMTRSVPGPTLIYLTSIFKMYPYNFK